MGSRSTSRQAGNRRKALLSMQGYSRPRLAVAAVAASAASLGGLAFGATSAHAASTLTVGGGGTYQKISDAMAHAASGDTISVAAGTYNEIVTPTAGVTVVGAANHASHVLGISASASGSVVDGFAVDNKGAGTAVTASGSVTIRNNQVSNSGLPSQAIVAPVPGNPSTVPPTPAKPGYGTGGKPAVSLSGAVIFTGNIVDHSVYSGVMVSGVGGATLRGNDIGTSFDAMFNNTGVPNHDQARYAAGVVVKTDHVTVAANFLHDNQDSGVQFYTGAGSGTNGDNGTAVNNVVVNNGDHGIDDLDVNNGTILNNTVVGNATAGINVEGQSTGYTVENNIAQDNGTNTSSANRSRGDIRIAQDATIAGKTVVDHNLLFQSNSADVYYVWDTVGTTGIPAGTGVNQFYGGNGGSAKPVSAFHGDTGEGASDKTGNAGFIGAGDYHIAAASPAAGLANQTVAGHPTTDKDGNAWAGSAGAYNAGSTGGPGGTTPPPGTGPAVKRLSGPTRFETGTAVSQAAFPTAGSAQNVIIATGWKFPDALSGVPLAKKLNAPLLLVDSNNPAGNVAVKNEIARVLASGGTVNVLGGTAAVPDAVVNAVLPAGAHTKRIAGNTRYETSVAIAQALGNPKNVVVARGDDGVNLTGFADALSAGPYAANVFGGGNGAVLLSSNTALDPMVKSYLAGATSVQAVGGPAATAVGTGANVKPAIVGGDRYETAAKVASNFSGEKTAGVAFGLKFPDALTGAALLADNNGPLLLAATDGVSDPTKVQLAGIGQALGTQGTIYVFCGTAVIS